MLTNKLSAAAAARSPQANARRRLPPRKNPRPRQRISRAPTPPAGTAPRRSARPSRTSPTASPPRRSRSVRKKRKQPTANPSPAAADAAAEAPESRRARASRRKPNNRQAPGQPLYKRTAGDILVLQSRFSPETALRRMRNRILVLRRSEGARYRPSSGSGSMQCRAGAPPCSEPLRTSGRGTPRAARQTG